VAIVTGSCQPSAEGAARTEAPSRPESCQQVLTDNTVVVDRRIHARQADVNQQHDTLDGCVSTLNHTSVGGVPDFWQRVRGARHVSLFLDYDGTLAPFHVERMQAVPLPGTAEALRQVIDGGLATVALVSGRPVAEVLTLLGDLGVVVVGAHGYEVYRPDGVKHVAQILPEQHAVLDSAFEQAVNWFDPARVERKTASVAVHFRGLDPRECAAAEAELEDSWRRAAIGGLIDFRPFNGGLELRAAGRTKGTAIQELLALAPAGTLPVYAGDDETDEDAFGVLPAHGIGIKVGPMKAVTKARGRLPDPAAVLALLRAWTRMTATA
jgi:trehalose-phosphatase